MVSVVIKLNFNTDIYTYDVYHIIKAFLPAEELQQNINLEQVECVQLEAEDGCMLSVFPEEVVHIEGKKAKKHYVNIKVYQWLAKMTERELSWGVLTGIRPTKIIMQRLETGSTKDEASLYFREHMLVSKQKTALSLEIAYREKELLGRLDYDNGYSLYVGIPFCPTTCSYCSFTSYPIADWKERVDEYLDALCKEISFVGKVAMEHQKQLNTVYIGGGTPTTLEPDQLDRLLAHIEETFSFEELQEITVEAGRPDSITDEKLNVLRSHSISRISINPQTMQQKTLDVIGRKHTVEDIQRVYRMARAKGFDNINMDLIAGLPGEVVEDMRETLVQIKDLAPDSITVHSLALKRASRLGQEKNKSAKGDAQAHILSEMIDMAAKCANEMDLLPYYMYRQKNIVGNFENVGYAKSDKAGIYNILIMEEKQTIVAVGAGASTKLVTPNGPEYIKENGKRIERVENVKDVELYITRIDEMIQRKEEVLWR